MNQIGITKQDTVKCAQMGKGSKRRPGDDRAYAENWDRIFSSKRKGGKNYMMIVLGIVCGLIIVKLIEEFFGVWGLAVTIAAILLVWILR